MITIKHTHADGTIIDGSESGDGVWEIAHPLGWRSHPDVGIYLRGSRDRDANRVKIHTLAEALRVAGYQVEVRVDNTARPAAEVEADRAERARRRADRYAGKASNAAAAAAGYREAARAATDGMVKGQPTLVGHHSEKGARRAWARSAAADEKSWDADKDARVFAGRAAAAEAGQERRHDPRVIMRRLERLRADRRAAERSGHGDRVAQLTEQIDYWQTQLSWKPFVPWTRELLAGASAITTGYGWEKLVRVNQKTVTVVDEFGERKVDLSKVFGCRRDGMQFDSPDGEPWPVEDARRVARWEHLLRHSSRPEDAIDQHLAGLAQRIVAGLPAEATDRETESAAPEFADVWGRRRYALDCMAVWERLKRGESEAEVRADVSPSWVPAWRIPDTGGERRHVRDVVAGDLVEGFYDAGDVSRQWCGPVVDFTPHKGDLYSGERFVGWWRVRLAGDVEPRELKPDRWLVVHPVGTWERRVDMPVPTDTVDGSFNDPSTVGAGEPADTDAATPATESNAWRAFCATIP